MAIRSSSRPWSALTAVLVAALVATTATTAVAGTPSVGVDRGSGKHGPFGYIESEAKPAGTCQYGYTPKGDDSYYNGVRKVIVEPPRARAGAGRTSQRIAWRLVVQAWRIPGGGWVDVRASTWRSKRATPTQRAPFTRRGLLIDSRPFHDLRGDYRAKVELRWYGRDDATVVGRAVLFPDLYAGLELGTRIATFDDLCGATTG